jgi:hypothetical protein
MEKGQHGTTFLGFFGSQKCSVFLIIAGSFFVMEKGQNGTTILGFFWVPKIFSFPDNNVIICHDGKG